MKILAVDPGEKRIGIAVSDPTGIIANPLTIIEHISRPIDAAQIVHLAEEHGSGLIVIGQALDEDGKPSLQGRRAARLMAAIQSQSSIPVILWDESEQHPNCTFGSVGSWCAEKKKTPTCRRPGCHGHSTNIFRFRPSQILPTSLIIMTLKQIVMR